MLRDPFSGGIADIIMDVLLNEVENDVNKLDMRLKGVYKRTS